MSENKEIITIPTNDQGATKLILGSFSHLGTVFPVSYANYIERTIVKYINSAVYHSIENSYGIVNIPVYAHYVTKEVTKEVVTKGLFSKTKVEVEQVKIKLTPYLRFAVVIPEPELLFWRGIKVGIMTYFESNNQAIIYPD